jgi:hypothetical protein
MISLKLLTISFIEFANILLKNQKRYQSLKFCIMDKY